MIGLMKRTCRRNSKCFFRNLQQGDIYIDELKEKVKNGAILLDVRSPQEYAEGHLNGAILLPDYEFNIRKNELEQYRNTTIVVYCGSGIRSRRICDSLKRMGFKNVYNLYGGLDSIL